MWFEIAYNVFLDPIIDEYIYHVIAGLKNITITWDKVSIIIK